MAWLLAGARGLTLQAITGLRLLPHNVQHGVDQLRALCVVPLGPVVACARLRTGRAPQTLVCPPSNITPEGAHAVRGAQGD